MECTNKILISRTPPLGPVKVPCGQCIACRLNRASSWAVRIMHEKKMSGDSCFITLTYDQECVPWVSDSHATLVKDDVRKFIKDLRNNLYPVKIRYYLCGEYGEQGARPHYHICLFGYFPKDLVLYKHTPAGDLWISPELSNIWKKGFVTVANLDFDSAAYVARYCTKLLTGKQKDWYSERNIIPEFSLMSRKPGIGARWLEKYGNEIKTHHNVVIKGRKMSPPRYYRDKVYDEVDRRVVRGMVFDKIIAQDKQIIKDDLISPTLPEEREAARERTLLARLKMRKRA